MGADLYIAGMFDENKKKYQQALDAAVSKRDSLLRGSPEWEEAQKQINELYDKIYSIEGGYFRDSYNVTSVLWAMGLSWWQDIGKLIDEEGNLPVDKIKEMLKMIESKQVDITTKQLEEYHAADANNVDAWYNFYVTKRESLITFLKMAIDKNSPIYASI